MPASVVIAIADAVAAALNAASLSLSFVAVRSYVPVFHKEDREGPDELAALTVCVVARELSMVTLSRRDDDFDYVVDVGVFKRIGSGDMTNDQVNAACDPLMRFVEELADLIRSEAVRASLPARFMGLANVPIYDPVKLDDERLFASLLSLSFKEARPRQ